ncbi:MAG: hypothetical protein AMXMBFR64_00740 [Myxococcales bacterium]
MNSPADLGGGIRIRGARQHNLRDVDVDIPLGRITVVTGPSGSGKSSLAFDTLYAEGQRRYVESFSAYARQFMDRMDRPDVDAVDGVLPAVAIDQTNAIRSSRSTVGTVTEIADHVKGLYARAGQLHCGTCGLPVRSEDPPAVLADLLARAEGRRAVVTFPLDVSGKAAGAAAEWLVAEGFGRLWDGRVVEVADAGLHKRKKGAPPIEVLVDRVVLRADDEARARIADSIETAMSRGRGRVIVHVEQGEGFEARAYSRGRHCARCDVAWPDPVENHFSFNSPLGACPACNGFGRIIALDLDLAIPDHGQTLAGGAIRPWTTDSTEAERRALARFCEKVGIPLDVPWRDLDDDQRRLVVDGSRPHRFPGVRGWFKWLEGKTYKMHVRVFLARYRAYVPCGTCSGARFQPHALLYRLGGLTLAQLYALDLEHARAFFDALELTREQAEAVAGLLREVRSRLRYLVEVGLGYLTLDRQSRTLSGGEVQRVNLTTAIGSHLVNTLYVLDEPSIGLHPRDNDRLMGILERLRANRNTIVVVEHDEAIIMRADHVIDMGPGAGDGGGRVVYEGSPAGLLGASSLTARFLSDGGRSAPRAPRPGTGHIRIRGARENNLRSLDVDIPLGALTVVAGVSGSGKSTLVEDVLHRGLLRQRGEPVEAPGAHDAITGADGLTAVVLVDQRPVGTTPRANPATYVKAWSAIRELFAALPESARLGFTGGTFSFNTAGGRCDGCEGTGFERIEMQFLSDVFVTCEQCGGRRFKEEVLSVRLRGRSVADVLDLTVSEAVQFFRTEVAARRPLEVLAQVGLDYLRLGQPLSTLSGGEAQRLKLAGHLGARGSTGALVLLDEPTTGLHVSDVRVLIDNLHRLVDQGNTVVVIEHHLDVIAAADHVIDLGPEGGTSGGGLVVAGPPEVIAAHEGSHTARFLRAHLGRAGLPLGVAEAPTASLLAPDDIEIRGARVHNLKNLSLRIPRDRLVVITGPSGSGKSSLAFDLLFAEGQRRFVDCLSPYARQYVQQLARPDLDELLGVPPTVSIAQRTTQSGRRSTVATITEIWHYLRLLWARLGVQHCHRCGAKASGLGADEVLARVMARHEGKDVRLLAPVVRGRKGFHKDVMERARAQGFQELRIDGRLVAIGDAKPLERFKEHDVEVVVARWTVGARPAARDFVAQALELGNGTIAVMEVETKRPRTYSRERWCESCEIGFDPPDPRTFSFNTSEGACPACDGTGEEGSPDDDAPPGLPCAECGGARLKPTARAVRFAGRGIAEVAALTPGGLLELLSDLTLTDREQAIAGPALAEVASRCLFLERVGLTYLTLDRGGHTLSGGEAQRIRLASQLGAQLSGVLYILDEPTIGLHPSDNDLLLDALADLQRRGNGVVIVEHDEATIRRAAHIIDMGPGGGLLGGHVTAQGTLADILASEASVTGRSLRLGAARSVRVPRPCPSDGARIGVRGFSHHNLGSVDADFPLGRLTVVTGVSGSGKSSLVRDGLARSVAAALRGEEPPARLSGIEAIAALREIDQAPIGKTPRSIPATYVGFYTAIRELFAGLPEARMRGFTAARFSFNTKGGRCEHCAGQGQVKHEMSFLPDVWVTCEVCGGRRFDEETLRVRYRDRTIHDVLAMTVDEAAALFEPVRRVRAPLALLSDVGLGYLHLGQASNALSGGEAQRVKLVEELARRGTGSTLYVMDEPSTGLHLDDLGRLLTVLHRLVDRGDTVVVIEHDLDVIAAADWVIDLGPGGGADGGRVVFQGPREELVRCGASRTAPYLRAHLLSGAA